MGLAEFVEEIRHTVGDTGIYRTHIPLVGQYNGINCRFQASLFPLGPDYGLYDGTGSLITTGYTFDVDSGLLVFSTPPSLASQYFLEGMVYRYKTREIQSALARACRWLYGVWGSTKYSASGSGGTLVISPEPVGHDLQIFITAASIGLATATRFEASAGAVRTSDTTGLLDTTARGEHLSTLVKSLQEELNQLITDGSYTLPQFSSVNHPLDYQGQNWTGKNVRAL